MRFDEVPSKEAVELLRACCGSSRWVSEMIESRPFHTSALAKQAADRIWNALPQADWVEAFDHHPRIGETKATAQDKTGAAWSAEEQARANAAGAQIKSELARVNAEYERQFGFIYIVYAAGKTAEEMLAIAKARLDNTQEEELRVAAEELRKIMQLRLGKLLDPEMK